MSEGVNGAAKKGGQTKWPPPWLHEEQDPPSSGMGVLRYVAKDVLKVDHDYQREHLKDSLLSEMVARWSWPACGVLLVARRPDDTLMVYDGQHRLAAANRIPTISKLPCIVFDFPTIEAEAKAFVEVNTGRGAVLTVDKFRAELRSKDPSAIEISEMVQASGYTISRAGGNHKTVRCLRALRKAYDEDSLLTRQIWALCVEVAADVAVSKVLFQGLYYAESYMRKGRYGTILHGRHHDTLTKSHVTTICKAAQAGANELGSASARTWGLGIIEQVLNKSLKKAAIPNPIRDKKRRSGGPE